MSRIRSKDTTPEKVVRSLLHRMGYRFRLHVRIPIPNSSKFLFPSASGWGEGVQRGEASNAETQGGKGAKRKVLILLNRSA